MKKSSVIVAMSGGVDSSVVASILKNKGFDVFGLFLKLHNNSKTREVKRIAKKLQIPLIVLDKRKEFKKTIIDYFLKEYLRGNTPNPCVLCNSEVKFKFLFQEMKKQKADFIATGHYAKNEKSYLAIPKDKIKDQTYLLWRLKKDILRKTLFPLGSLTKKEVKKIAEDISLDIKEKESQEICFISNGIDNFLKTKLKGKRGKIVSDERKILGSHKGLFFYTIGQRKKIGLSGGPWYVIKKDVKKNELVISKSDLGKRELFFKQGNFFLNPKIKEKVKVKIRYNSNFVSGIFYKGKIIFDRPQKSITKGQSVVFYRKEKLIGGGVIK